MVRASMFGLIIGILWAHIIIYDAVCHYDAKLSDYISDGRWNFPALVSRDLEGFLATYLL